MFAQLGCLVPSLAATISRPSAGRLVLRRCICSTTVPHVRRIAERKAYIPSTLDTLKETTDPKPSPSTTTSTTEQDGVETGMPPSRLTKKEIQDLVFAALKENAHTSPKEKVSAAWLGVTAVAKFAGGVFWWVFEAPLKEVLHPIAKKRVESTLPFPASEFMDTTVEHDAEAFLLSPPVACEDDRDLELGFGNPLNPSSHSSS
ncbi:hypothetical protein HK102_008798, partial [Quaeritorhiza haematococci]